MRTTESYGSFLNRISIHRNQVVSMESIHDQEHEDLEVFQKHLADRFSDLLPSPASTSVEFIPPEAFLDIDWLRKLLDTFLCCEAEFKAVVIMGRDPLQFCKPPLDRLVPEFLERTVKALDICNAITHGIELVLHWQKLAEIAVCALQQRSIGEGQIRRAKKSLTTLLTSMAFDDKDGSPNELKTTEGNLYFERRGGGGGASMTNHKNRSSGNFRSFSFWLTKSWSAAKQIRAMSANLTVPHGWEQQNGLASSVYTMSTVLVFVMWALVAALPCQDRNGLSTHLAMPRQLNWCPAIIGLQEKIGEELKKQEKRGTAGLLEEIQRMEKVARALVDSSGSFQFPVEDEKADDAAVQVLELEEIYIKMVKGLVPLQQQVREVFHRIVRSRAEVLDVLDQAAKQSVTIPH